MWRLFLYIYNMLKDLIRLIFRIPDNTAIMPYLLKALIVFIIGFGLVVFLFIQLGP